MIKTEVIVNSIFTRLFFEEIGNQDKQTKNDRGQKDFLPISTFQLILDFDHLKQQCHGKLSISA